MSWTRFEDALKTFLQEVLKTSWQDVLRTSWRHLEDVFKTSWGCLDDVLARRLEDLLKSYGPNDYIGLSHEVLKTSSEDAWMNKVNIFVLIMTSWRRLLKTKTKDVFKTSTSRQMFAGFAIIKKLWSFMVKKIFIETRLCNPITYFVRAYQNY